MSTPAQTVRRGPSIRRAAGWGLLLLATGAVAFGGQDDDPSRDVLNHWIEAIGGSQAIADLKSVDYHCDISFGPGTPTIDTYIQATAAGSYRYEYKLPAFGVLVEAFDGRFAWEHNDVLGFGALSREEHEQNLGGIDFRAPIRVGRDFPRRTLLPDETIGGLRRQVVELTDRSGVKAKWFFAPDTGLRVRMEVDGAGGPVVLEYSDFRTVQGVQLPFRTVRRAGGREMAVTLRSALYNEGEDPALFVAPSDLMEDFGTVEQVLQRYVASTGAEALRAVRTRFTREEIDVTTTHLRIPATIYQKRPNLFLMKQEVPGLGSSWEGFDGQNGWAWSELEGFRTMKGAELQQLLFTADLDGPTRMLALCPLRRLLDEKDEGDRHLVEIALASIQGPAGNFYFDTRTGYLVRTETFAQAGANGRLKIVADFSDYRNVGGVMTPYVTTLVNPAMRTIVRIESIKENEPLDDAVFQARKGE